ncbi:MAG: ribonuclease PH, partial [Pseudomonadota bacterium]
LFPIWMSLFRSLARLQKLGLVKTIPLVDQVAGVSCGIHRGGAVLDLDYAEDSSAEADANFVFTGRGGIVEIQGTAEAAPFTEAQFGDLVRLARKGVTELLAHQRRALGL